MVRHIPSANQTVTESDKFHRPTSSLRHIRCRMGRHWLLVSQCRAWAGKLPVAPDSLTASDRQISEACGWLRAGAQPRQSWLANNGVNLDARI
jgi:hypothetical protein